MSELKLPLWFVTEREREPIADSATVFAFTSTTPFVRLMVAGQAWGWQVHLVANKNELLLMLADIHQKGINQVCIDASADGTGGNTVALEELVALCRNEAV